MHVILPQKRQTIKSVALSQNVRKQEIAELIQRQLRVDLLHPDFIEIAPDNWHEIREMTARFRYDRPDLASLDLVTYEEFRRNIDLTMPVFIKTDGACSGNPGPGGWGFIIAQCNCKIEAYGAEGHTTNNEMELRAIDEALGFFKNVRGCAVIESDSQGCLNVMMGQGERWEADNYTRLDGRTIKNRELVQSITAKLRSFNVQFRKVEGHSDDPWNDAVDALAVKCRDDAATGPKCTFHVITPARSIAFRERALRATEPWAQVYTQFKLETEEELPTFLDVRIFKNGAEHTRD
jgi:ribonuclease HI